MQTVYLTKHATKRMAERCGINRSGMQRMAQKVYDLGLTRNDIATGPVSNWLAQVCEKSCDTDNLRLYGDKCYVFNGVGGLVTVLQIPTGLQKNVNGRMAKQRAAISA